MLRLIFFFNIVLFLIFFCSCSGPKPVSDKIEEEEEIIDTTLEPQQNNLETPIILNKKIDKFDVELSLVAKYQINAIVADINNHYLVDWSKLIPVEAVLIWGDWTNNKIYKKFLDIKLRNTYYIWRITDFKSAKKYNVDLDYCLSHISFNSFIPATTNLEKA